MEPAPDFRQSHLRKLKTNLAGEPLSNPVTEEEDAQARDVNFDRFFAVLLPAQGFVANASLPAWWHGSMFGAGGMTSGCPRIGSARPPLKPGVIRDAPLRSGVLTPATLAWHLNAAGGRPPHRLHLRVTYERMNSPGIICH
jgi:hypothetical protein